MEFFRWGVFTLVVAALVHIGVVLYLPNIAMSKLASALEARGDVNAIQHAPRPDETSRGVVKPSPDLVYSICPYDVSVGPIRLTSPVPDTYWSLSAFANDTENFLVINDVQAGANRVDLLLVAPDQNIENPENLPIMIAKTLTGVLLTRTLIPSDDKFSELNALRQQASCAPYLPQETVTPEETVEEGDAS
jgi:uncharacterized membrane protein